MRELDRYTLRLHRYTRPSGGSIDNLALEATTARSDDGAIAAAARAYVSEIIYGTADEIEAAHKGLIATVRGKS